MNQETTDMKHNIKRLCYAAAAVACVATQATAAPKKYVRLDAGYSHTPKKIISNSYVKKQKDAFVGTFGLGYVFGPKWRADVTVTHRGNYRYKGTTSGGAPESQNVSSSALMLSGYMNFMGNATTEPYVMAGAGASANEAGDYHSRNAVAGPVYLFGDQKINFAWQVGVGTLIKIKNNLSADLMYKYADLGKVATSGTGVTSFGCFKSIGRSGKLRAHELSVGLNLKF